jgi:hypothetical protein
MITVKNVLKLELERITPVKFSSVITQHYSIYMKASLSEYESFHFHSSLFYTEREICHIFKITKEEFDSLVSL